MENYKHDPNLFNAILNSIPTEIVAVDINHKIIYANQFARKKYSKTELKKGMSIFDCHKQEKSHKIIKEAFEKLEKGKDRVYIYTSDKKGQPVYLIAIRDQKGNLLGYYELFD